MSLKLTYFAETSVPVEIEGLTPDWACDKSLAEIERFEIFHGNRRVPLAELFRVTGDAGDRRVEFEGNLAGVHWIGAHLTSGEITVQGPAGRHVGSGMRGGRITVEGNTSDWTGAEMRGGTIQVRGDAGQLVGAAYRGSAKGMKGGTICVDGNAGDEVGLLMRRGLIAIGGSAGDMLGFHMIAGTVLVFGDCGMRPGSGMRRGTLGLFGVNRPKLLPSFSYGATYRPPVVPILMSSLRRTGFRVDESLMSREFELYRGDMLALGQGEVLFPCTAAA